MKNLKVQGNSNPIRLYLEPNWMHNPEAPSRGLRPCCRLAVPDGDGLVQGLGWFRHYFGFRVPGLGFHLDLHPVKVA